MRVAVLQFPGSNGDHDIAHAFGPLLGCDVQWAWHADAELPAGTELAVLPGGFSYGDYLRCGAIAARAPILAAVRRLAEQGGTVLGVCNGFQILTEAQLLPGTLLRNAGMQFVCKDVALRVESQQSRLTRRWPLHSRVVLPIAHMDGGCPGAGRSGDPAVCRRDHG
jgi:phosphoribosylformylglycinamidine synthase I